MMFSRFWDWIRTSFTKTSSSKKRSLTDEEFIEFKSKRQKKLDSILDKISKNGIESLSNSEKNFLDNFQR